MLLPACAQTASPAIKPRGIAWKVQGNWRLATPGSDSSQGRTLQAGSPVPPGVLLVAAAPEAQHSITIFLPDGQRILYECFTQEDCIRGFRVPALTEQPSEFAQHLLDQVSNQILRNAKQRPRAATEGAARTTPAKLDEALATIDPKGKVTVGGLLSALPDGAYTYSLTPLKDRESAQVHLTLQKTASTCLFTVPGPGLYEIALTDADSTPRINLFLAAIQPSQQAAFSSYPKAKKLLTEWDAEYYGWPLHDFLRAYLHALMETAPAK
jgi:hypothetical protein